MTEKVDKLTREFLELLKKGNVMIEEVVLRPENLADHPDFDKAIDLLAALDEELNG